MKVLIDARTVRPHRTGVGNYTESMLMALDQILPDYVTAEAVILNRDYLPGLSNIKLRETKSDYESHPMGEWYENVTLSRELQGFDVFWGPAFLIPWVKTYAAKVVTIHDVTTFTHAGSYPWQFAAYMRFAIAQAVRAADAVVTVSCSGRDELLRCLPRAKERRIDTILCAADEFYWGYDETPLPPIVHKPYVLAVGGSDPRKNNEMVVEAHRRLYQKGSIEQQLVLVGHYTKPIHDGMVLLPWQEKPALRRLYREADLLVFPSLFEGFGLPVLEAMASGCPVLASNSGAVPEVAGDAAALFDSSDITELEARLLQVVQDSDLRAALRDKGHARAAHFSWNSSALQLLDLFRSVMKSRS